MANKFEQELGQSEYRIDRETFAALGVVAVPILMAVANQWEQIPDWLIMSSGFISIGTILTSELKRKIKPRTYMSDFDSEHTEDVYQDN